MTNGLGTGFFALAVLAVLLGLAALLALSLAGTVLVRRRSGTVRTLLTYFSVVVLVVALAVAGFGVVVLYDEAAVPAALFLVLVFLPVAAVGRHLHRETDLPRADAVATIGLAWSLPFVAGLIVVFGVTIGAGAVFDLAPVESRRLGVPWIATGLGGAVAVVGSVVLGARLGRVLPPPATA